jgi:hypothetical protein
MSVSANIFHKGPEKMIKPIWSFELGMMPAVINEMYLFLPERRWTQSFKVATVYKGIVNTVKNRNEARKRL